MCLPTPSQVYHHDFVGSGGHLSQVFDIRALSYLEHCDAGKKELRTMIIMMKRKTAT